MGTPSNVLKNSEHRDINGQLDEVHRKKPGWEHLMDVGVLNASSLLSARAKLAKGLFCLILK